MARGKKAYIEARIASLMDELEKTELIEARFGTDSDYAIDTVLNCTIRFTEGGRSYSYCFIKIKADTWYSTATGVGGGEEDHDLRGAGGLLLVEG